MDGRNGSILMETVMGGSMGRVILCVGNYAETPYYMESGDVRIYCLEELCFFLRENALLLDQDVMKPELGEWLKQECGLTELALELKRYRKEKKTLNEFVHLIMKSANYCTEQEWKELDRLLEESKNWNSNERVKGRTDYHFQNGKYFYSLRAYESLYREIREQDPDLAAKLLHNLGSVYARLYLFEIAASYYKRAYELGGEEQSLTAYLAANRMFLPEQKYIDLVAEYKECQQDVLQLEKKFERLRNEFEETEYKKQLDALIDFKNAGNMSAYYNKLEELVQNRIADYRESALER